MLLPPQGLATETITEKLEDACETLGCCDRKKQKGVIEKEKEKGLVCQL